MNEEQRFPLRASLIIPAMRAAKRGSIAHFGSVAHSRSPDRKKQLVAAKAPSESFPCGKASIVDLWRISGGEVLTERQFGCLTGQ